MPMNHDKSAEYLAAVAQAQREVAHGDAVAYLTGYSHERGRYVCLESDQGWGHEPMWQEHQPEPAMGANDTLGD